MKRTTLLRARKLATSRRFTALALFKRNIDTFSEGECWARYERYDRLVEKLDKRLSAMNASDA